MRKQRIENPRYPHTVWVVRATLSDWLSGEQEDTWEYVYNGAGRCYTSGGVNGQSVDITSRQISIPVRFDEWNALHPSSGDTVIVAIGNIRETMELKDFEADNNRAILYCKRNGNFDL